MTSAAALALVVLVAWAPGLALLRVARIRGVVAVGAAPAVSTGVLAVGAVVVAAAGLRWSPWTAAATVGAILLAAASWRRWAPRRAADGASPRPGLPRASSSAHRCRLALAVAAGVALQLVPLVVGAGSPGRFPVAHDAVTHLTALTALRAAGTASSLEFWSVVAPLGTPEGPYAAGWHAIGTLLPAWPDAAVMTNVLTFVPSALAWTSGLVALTAASLPRRPRAWAWAGVLSAGGGAVPLVLVLRPEGMIPNAFALSLLPGVLALGVVLVRVGRASGALAWAVGLAALAGLVAAHPNTVITASVMVAPAGAVRLVRVLRTSGWQARAAAAGALAAAAGAVAVAVANPAGARVLSFPQESPEPTVWALTWLASGDLTRQGPAAGFLLVLAGVVAGILARRLPAASWLVGAGAAIALLYLASTSSVPVLTDVDRAWYGEPRRFGPALLVAVVPLAALALDTVPRWALATGRVRTGLPRRATAAALAAVVALPGVVGGAVGLGQAARETFAPEALGRPGFADPDELAMMHRLRGVLDPHGAVLGSPFSGAAHLAAVADQRVVLPATIDVEHDALTYVRRHLGDLGTDPALCGALDELDVRYLYVDPAPWGVGADQVDITAVPPAGTRVVDGGGGATVVEVTAC